MAKDLNLWPNKSREATSQKEQRNLFSERAWREGSTFKYRIIINSMTYTGEAPSESKAKRLAEEKAEKAGVNLEHHRKSQKVSTGRVSQLN